jgi:shikimate kinase
LVVSIDSLFLIGLMGAGKSTVGKRLASAMDWRFVDSDDEIEHRTGAPIPLIFELEGEAGFRARERTMIDELTQRRRIVLATGGGAVLDAENRRRLKERGWVVYLYASVDQLYARTARDRNRPLLRTADPRLTLEELLRVRDPLYRKTADYVVDTTGQPVAATVRSILDRMD